MLRNLLLATSAVILISSPALATEGVSIPAAPQSGVTGTISAGGGEPTLNVDTPGATVSGGAGGVSASPKKN